MDLDSQMDSQIESCVPSSFPKESLKIAINYKPNKNDLFIVSYPKCGTTWTQQIVYLLINDGNPPQKTILFSNSIPFLEFCEPKPQELGQNKKRYFKTHLPFHLIPFDENAKYIYCLRNPKDCCVSFWFHERDFPLIKCKDFNQFFDVFMNGKTGYGDYFDHILGWIKQKHRNNILFVKFEDLKNNFNEELNRIAKFISNDIFMRFTNDMDFRKRVIDFSDFEFMRKTTNQQMKTFFNLSSEELKSDEQILDKFKDAFSNIKQNESIEISTEVNFVRKGIIGDYKTHFSEYQNQIMNNKIKDKLSEFPELMDEWKQFLEL